MKSEFGYQTSNIRHRNRTSDLNHRALLMFIGLRASKKVLDKKIEKRVKKRLKQGFEKEIKNLLDEGVSWKYQSMQALGYRQWLDYYLGKVDIKEAVVNWIKEEKKYARRQMTWFKKDKRIQWFNVSKKDYQQEVEKVVGKWYSQKSNQFG